MERMKVAITDYIEDDLDWEKTELAKAGIELAAHQLKFRPEEEIIAATRDADVVVVNMVKMTDAVISRMAKCRLLIRHGIGCDNVDIASCTRHGIPFAYQPDYCTEDVAEHAIALLFACARKLPASRAVLDRSVAKGEWDFGGLFPLSRMQGKTLGIMGAGRIGVRIAQKLSAFGLRILAHDPLLSEERRRELGLEWVEQDALFRASDFLTIHTPLNDQTRHIVNARTLALMKKTAYLINTARGGMVDIDALAAALRSGSIAGAALDVYDREPPPPDFPLYDMENVILTPHTGWASLESGWEIRRNILADILAAAEGKPPRCLVNKDVKPRTRS
jgi:D-3-phosphoglycerate dehydrogenase